VLGPHVLLVPCAAERLVWNTPAAGSYTIRAPARTARYANSISWKPQPVIRSSKGRSNGSRQSATSAWGKLRLAPQTAVHAVSSRADPWAPPRRARRQLAGSQVDVLLGGGRRLFDQLPERIELEQTGLSKTDGVAHLEYRVVR
jgi:hypothetical protein